MVVSSLQIQVFTWSGQGFHSGLVQFSIFLMDPTQTKIFIQTEYQLYLNLLIHVISECLPIHPCLF